MAIASMLFKMALSPRHKVKLVDTDRAYIEMTETMWRWVELPSNLQEVHFGPKIQKDAKKFICLAYLGSGAEGLVWLATTEYGTGCVIKLASAIKPLECLLTDNPVDEKMKEEMEGEEQDWKKALDNLQAEAGAWKTLWGIDATVQMVGGQPALIMPYLWMCGKDKLDANKKLRNAAEKALLLMVSKGYKHNDLSPRHVGFYQQSYKGKKTSLHAVFIDLSSIEKVPKDDQETIKEMMERLHLS